MYLVQMIYASRISTDFKTQDIESILESAHKNNAALGITGLLCFSHDSFLQSLEGSRKAVNEVYQKILNDQRHQDPILLYYKNIQQRNFVDWAMGYVSSSQMIRQIVLKYSRQSEFDAFEMSGDSARALMIELADNIPVQTGKARHTA